jgi:excinuclease UvrABC nuclease subunit
MPSKDSQSFDAQLKNIPARPGLLYVKNSRDKVIHIEAAAHLQEAAKKCYFRLNKNHEILKLEYELTGTTLIAQIMKQQLSPKKTKWSIGIKDHHTFWEMAAPI